MLLNVSGESGEAHSVSRVLHSQSVIGRLVSVKNNTVIDDYYPPIIEKEIFFAVQEKMTERNNRGKGRKGETISNLFSGLCVCGDCGGKMRMVKVKSNKKVESHNVYIECLNSYHGNGCDAKRINYPPLEKALLHDLLVLWSIEFDSPKSIMVDPATTIRAEIQDKTDQIEKILDLMEASGRQESVNLIGRLKKREDELDELKQKLITATPAIDPNQQANEARTILEQHEKLKNSDSEELREVRLRLQTTIRHFVDLIKLPSKIEPGYENPPKQYRIAYMALKPSWHEKLWIRDFGSDEVKDILDRLHGSKDKPFETWYEVPTVGFQPGNRVGLRGRPRKNH